MLFKLLHLERFRSLGQVDLNLDSLGFMRIDGINKDTATAESNGAGKSSIVEGIHWILFGKTIGGGKNVTHMYVP